MPLSRELRLRLRKVRAQMGLAGALYSQEEADLRYLTGRDTGRVLVTPDRCVLWVKEIYSELYSSTYSLPGYPLQVRTYDKEDVKRTLRGLRVLTVSSPAAAEAVRKAVRRKVAVSDAVKQARAVKTAEEIGLIRRSCAIAKAGMRKAEEVIRPGVKELYAVAEIEGELRRRGSEKAAFGDGMLLASGPGSADIHAKPTFRRITRGPVVADLGATYRGYFSDMTRTFRVGRLRPEEARVMALVEAVRDETIRMIRPGMACSDVHAFVEGRLKDAGYTFHHLSGHGVGLQIHESPSFSPESKASLAAGMVFTVEPGVYLPGKFGVRFEDTVLLGRRGCVKLT
jgi:Xaa-Pro dipeptidase